MHLAKACADAARVGPDHQRRRALGSRLLERFVPRDGRTLFDALADVLRKVAVDARRRSRARKRRAESPDVEYDDGAPPPRIPQTPSARVRSAERIDLCRRHLTAAEWDAWQRVVLLCETSAAAAREMGISDSSVRSRLQSARAKLRGVLRDLEPPA